MVNLHRLVTIFSCSFAFAAVVAGPLGDTAWARTPETRIHDSRACQAFGYGHNAYNNRANNNQAYNNHAAWRRMARARGLNPSGRYDRFDGYQGHGGEGEDQAYGNYGNPGHAVPELDPNLFAAAALLLLGGTLVLRGRRPRPQSQV